MSGCRLRLARRLAAVRGDDEGSALILALLIVLLVGAILAAVLNYQGAGFALAPQMQSDRNEANYLQGAVEGAVNNIRGSSDAGKVGRTCPSFTPTVPSGLVGVTGHTFRVDCSPQTSPLPGGNDDAPSYAILTVGTAPGEGIAVTKNNPLFINGPIYSNGTVTTDDVLRINGTLNAVGTCTGTILTTDAAGSHCHPPSFSAGDPFYTPPVADQTALNSLINSSGNDDLYADPKPVCGSSTITFSPGYYESRPDLLAAKFACNASLWVFSSGTYVFDYTGDWQVKGYQVIGGNLTPGHTASDSLNKACVQGTSAVQFVFQGSGTITTQSANGSSISGIELCGPQTSSGTPPQRIVLYGNTSHDTGTTTESSMGSPLTLTASTGPTPSTSSGSTASWTLPTAARVTSDGGLSAVTNETLNGFTENKTATLTYDLANSVPKGARVTSVKLRVGQSLSKATSAVQVTSTGSPSRLTPFTKDPASCTIAAPCDITANITSASDVPWRVLRSLRVTYTATADADSKKGGPDPHAASVDGVELLVTFTAPTFRQQSSSGTFFDSTTNPNVFMRGTVDTPAAGWSVSVHNGGESIFDRGVIVRTLAVQVSASSKQSTSPFQLPQGDTAGRYVWFRGYVDGTEKLRACVLYRDTGPSDNGSTAYFGYQVDIRHWLFMRTTSTQGSSC